MPKSATENLELQNELERARYHLSDAEWNFNRALANVQFFTEELDEFELTKTKPKKRSDNRTKGQIFEDLSGAQHQAAVLGLIYEKLLLKYELLGCHFSQSDSRHPVDVH